MVKIHLDLVVNLTLSFAITFIFTPALILTVSLINAMNASVAGTFVLPTIERELASNWAEE